MIVVARDPDALRGRRLELGLSQKQVFERIREEFGPGRGSIPTISDAEQGRPIRQLSAALIARILGRPVEDLFKSVREPEEAAAS